MDERDWKLLQTADDVTDTIEENVISAVDWFLDETRLATDDFIDQLCKTYGGNGYGPDDWDITDLNSPAVKKIMKIARAAHRDATA